MKTENNKFSIIQLSIINQLFNDLIFN